MALGPTNELFLWFCEVERQMSPHTVAAYRADLADFAKFLAAGEPPERGRASAFAPRAAASRDAPEPAEADAGAVPAPLAAVGEETLRAYLTEMIGERRLSVATVRRRFACLRAFFRWLEEASGSAAPGQSAAPPGEGAADLDAGTVPGGDDRGRSGIDGTPFGDPAAGTLAGTGTPAGFEKSPTTETPAGPETVARGGAIAAPPENPFNNFRLRLPRRKRLPRTLSRPEAAALMGSLRPGRTSAGGSRASRPAPPRNGPGRPGGSGPAFVRTAPPPLPSDPFAVALQLMVATGIRVGELTRLRLDDVTPDGAAVRIHGKGSRDRIAYVPDAALAAAIATLRASRARSASGAGASPLFVNRRGTALRPQSIRARLRTLAQAAGVSRRVTPHMLRHTAATLLIETGVDIRFVQRLLGHASIATTEIYTHVSDEALRATLARADVLGALRPS